MTIRLSYGEEYRFPLKPFLCFRVTRRQQKKEYQDLLRARYEKGQRLKMIQQANTLQDSKKTQDAKGQQKIETKLD